MRRFRLFDEDGLDAGLVKTLRIIIIAGAGGTVWGNITGGVAITGYLKNALGATDFQYGLLMALAPCMNAFQFLASYCMERFLDRTKLFLASGLVQRVVWLPFALIPYVIPMEAPALRLWTAGLLMLVSAGMMPLINVSFFSICADVVPVKIRGRYFSVRSRFTTLVSLVVGLAVGWLLDALPGYGGYAVAFSVASAFGVADFVLFFFAPLPPLRRAGEKTGLLTMMKPVFRDKNYVRLAVFGLVWYFSVNLSSYYFLVYARGPLAMSNLSITLYNQIAANVVSILVIALWGRGFDRYGNRPLLLFITSLTSTVPLLWAMVRPGNDALVLVQGVMSGACWLAFEVGAQNLFMGLAPRENRSMFFAVYYTCTQLGVALSSVVGGWLLDNPLAALEALGWTAGPYAMTRYQYLFVLSFLLRIASVQMLHGIREPGEQRVADMLTDLKNRAAARLTARKRRS